MKSLQGKVAVVAGATRGAGRGIACMLGEAGATVYCTGRSVRGNLSSINRPETSEETAEMVTAYGFTDMDGRQPPGYCKEGRFRDGYFIRVDDESR